MMTDDIQLRQSILDELGWDTHFDATHVAVTTDGGTVTLTGHVNSYPAIFAVHEAVRHVNGVRAIASELTVQLPSTSIRDDTDIAKSITHMVESHVRFNDTNITAEVNDGTVSLFGVVDWHNEREHAQTLIAHIQGVRKIRNLIKIRKILTPHDVKNQIDDALSRNAKLEAAHIVIKVNGDEVTLTGRVKAFYERNLVEAAVWNAPGVHKVIDKIEVG